MSDQDMRLLERGAMFALVVTASMFFVAATLAIIIWMVNNT